MRAKEKSFSMKTKERLMRRHIQRATKEQLLTVSETLYVDSQLNIILKLNVFMFNEDRGRIRRSKKRTDSLG